MEEGRIYTIKLMTCIIHSIMVIMCRPVGRNFQKGRGGGGSSTRIASRAARGRGSGVFGAKSCNLAISRHFYQNFGKSCFSKLIFKIFIKFYINKDFDKHKTSTLMVQIPATGMMCIKDL